LDQSQTACNVSSHLTQFQLLVLLLYLTIYDVFCHFAVKRKLVCDELNAPTRNLSHFFLPFLSSAISSLPFQPINSQVCAANVRPYLDQQLLLTVSG